METLVDKSFRRHVAYFVVPSSVVLSQYFWTSSEMHSLVAIPFDDFVIPDPPTSAHILWGIFPLVEKVDISGRQRNESDNPPGLGFKALAKAKAYLPMTTLHRSAFVFNLKPQFIPWMDGYFPIDTRALWQELQSSTAGSWSPEFNQELHDLQIKAENKAIMNLYASLGKRREINGGVIIAELRKTMDTLGNACTTLLLAVRDFRRGRIRDGLNKLLEYSGGRVDGIIPKTQSRATINRRRRKRGEKPLSKGDYLSNSWLETHFAWLPVIEDIHNIIEYIEKTFSHSERDSTWLSYTGYSGWFDLRDAIYRPPAVAAFLKVHDLNLTVSRRWRVSYTATFRMKDPVKDVLNSVGLLNPASVAWEIVPFSFVLDWFIPVGNWIDSFTAHAGLELLEVCRSEKRYERLTTTRPRRNLLPGYYHNQDEDEVVLTNEWSNYGEPFSYAYSYFRRDILSRSSEEPAELPPFPQVTASLEDILQPWKLITSLALFKALTGKR